MGVKEVRPQPVQSKFLSSNADIAIYGGQAGGGKTYALLMECIRHIDVPGFSAIIFRRESKQIYLPGGLYDSAMEFYPGLGCKHRQQPMLEFNFKPKAKIVMTHLGIDSDLSSFQGAQIPLICWDELTHFARGMFFYMLSRNRSACGVRPYMRGTCNPDPESWVADFIGWWIDQDTGYPIKERGGVIRYFITVPDETDTRLIWGSSKEDVLTNNGLSKPSEHEFQEALRLIDDALKVGEDIPDDHASEAVIYAKFYKSIKSATFIPASIFDNRELIRQNPEYLSNLKALSRVERERLLYGNWKIRPAAGLYFSKSDARIIPELPNDIVRVLRIWDLAATEPNETNKDPDWTVGMKLGRRKNGRVVIMDVARVRKKASHVRDLVLTTAHLDGRDCPIHLNQDPGQAGKDQIDSYRHDVLKGFKVFSSVTSKDKVTVAEPAAAAWQNGRIEVLLDPSWNKEVIEELDKFPTQGVHDDCVDALSNGYNALPSSATPNYGQGSGMSRKYRD